jgi:hypothetical protein
MCRSLRNSGSFSGCGIPRCTLVVGIVLVPFRAVAYLCVAAIGKPKVLGARVVATMAGLAIA